MAHSLSRQLKTAFLSPAIFFIFASSVFCAEEVRVEGIMHDDADAKQSAAILNGTLVKEGDPFGAYKILRITSKAVFGINEKTGETVQWLPAEKSGHENTLPQSERDTASPKKSFFGNPLEFLGGAGETRAVSDIHRIYRAILIYHEKHDTDEGFAAPDFKQLIAENLLSGEFAGGIKGKYRFTITASRSGFEVNADPLDPAAKFVHFYIGQDGVLREEKGLRAHAKSPIHEY